MSDDAPAKIRTPARSQDLNEVIRYTLWSVFKLKTCCRGPAGYADEVQELSTSSPRRT